MLSIFIHPPTSTCNIFLSIIHTTLPYPHMLLHVSVSFDQVFGQVLELWGFLCTFSTPLKIVAVPSLNHFANALKVGRCCYLFFLRCCYWFFGVVLTHARILKLTLTRSPLFLPLLSPSLSVRPATRPTVTSTSMPGAPCTLSKLSQPTPPPQVTDYTDWEKHLHPIYRSPVVNLCCCCNCYCCYCSCP